MVGVAWASDNLGGLETTDYNWMFSSETILYLTNTNLKVNCSGKVTPAFYLLDRFS